MLAIYPIRVAPDVGALPLIGGMAVLLLAITLALGLMAGAPFAIGLLAAELLLMLAAQQATGSVTAAIYGVGLLVVAEMACWSIQLQTPSRAESGLIWRQALTIAGVALMSLGIAAGAALLSRAPIGGSLPLLGSGVGALFVTVAIVVVIIWRSDLRRS